jgi:hypothetical protein
MEEMTQSFVGSILTVQRRVKQRFTTKLHPMGLVQDKKKFRKRHVLTEEKLDDTDPLLDAFQSGLAKVQLTFVQTSLTKLVVERLFGC